MRRYKDIKKVLSDTFSSTWGMLVISWQMDPKITFLYYFTATIGALVPVASSYAAKILIDSLENEVLRSSISIISISIVSILSIQFIVGLIESVVFYGWKYSYFDYLFRNKLQNELTTRYNTKVSTLDIAYFEDPGVQNLMSKVSSTMQWQMPDIIRSFSFLIESLVSYGSAFIILLNYGIWVPLVVTVITLPRMYLRAKYGALQWSMWGAGAPQSRKLWYYDSLLQNQTSVKEARISGSSPELIKRFKSLQQHLYDINKNALDIYLRVATFPPIAESIVIFLIAYKFLPLAISGALSIGSYTLFVSMLRLITDKSGNISAKIGELYEKSLYANMYFKFIALPQIVKESNNPKVFAEIKPPEIEFRNVSFSYTDDREILNNVSFKINAGENVAFVGSNGAGKTTIVKLLCRFYDVSNGEILINGINIKDLSIKNWYKFLGTLFQEFTRYHFTVRENITLGSPDKNDEEAMIQAAKKSGASEFIEKLPKKYDQMLGREYEDGLELSGGQWQKLAIARAFYEEPPVLILDEPTSAIDAEAEYEIFQNLHTQYKDKTLILVSHRFSTVRNADKIIVIDQGRIIESGSHDDLMKLDGKYAKMFKIQAKGYS